MITGTGEPAARVTVVDQNNRTVCAATVQPDGGWSCNPAAPLACGTTLAAYQTDAAGNVSPVSLRTSTGIPACPAGGGQLPTTGSSSTLPTTMVAAGLLLAGLLLLGLRRSLRVRA
jgi:LPXTG-motif cell wall-anchored protein